MKGIEQIISAIIEAHFPGSSKDAVRALVATFEANIFKAFALDVMDSPDSHRVKADLKSAWCEELLLKCPIEAHFYLNNWMLDRHAFEEAQKKWIKTKLLEQRIKDEAS